MPAIVRGLLEPFFVPARAATDPAAVPLVGGAALPREWPCPEATFVVALAFSDAFAFAVPAFFVAPAPILVEVLDPGFFAGREEVTDFFPVELRWSGAARSFEGLEALVADLEVVFPRTPFRAALADGGDAFLEVGRTRADDPAFEADAAFFVAVTSTSFTLPTATPPPSRTQSAGVHDGRVTIPCRADSGNPRSAADLRDHTGSEPRPEHPAPGPRASRAGYRGRGVVGF
ncbi:MAG: hypothetical protein ACYCVN_03625 [Acidimicrobiales bacterium]